MTDIIIIAVILALCLFAVRSVIKRKGKCSCGCESCKNCKNFHEGN